MSWYPNTPFRLFTATFLSAFVLLMGVLTLLATYWPLLYTLVAPKAVYQPRLPLAADQTEPFYDINQERAAAKRLYPALGLPEDVAEGNWIRMPSIGVAVPLVQSASMLDRDVLAVLDAGAALYPNGIEPGRLGTTFISAHSTGEPWKGRYRFAFLRINELGAGNFIHLDWEGTRYTYRVVRSDVIKPDPNTRIASDRPVPKVIVMACWPLWSTRQRMLVHGELTNVTKLTPRPA